MYRIRWRIRRRKRRTSVTQHYLKHKEAARKVILAKIAYWNTYYQFTFNRIAIRNTRNCWGSCTSLKNLNFSYKILFLPEHLQDYIVVHELCHLEELNHKPEFWQLVQRHIPNYKACIKELKLSEHDLVTAARAFQKK